MEDKKYYIERVFQTVGELAGIGMIAYGISDAVYESGGDFGHGLVVATGAFLYAACRMTSAVITKRSINDSNKNLDEIVEETD